MQLSPVYFSLHYISEIYMKADNLGDYLLQTAGTPKWTKILLQHAIYLTSCIFSSTLD